MNLTGSAVALRAMARQTTAGTPSILPKSFCSNNLRNLIHSNRRFCYPDSGSPILGLQWPGRAGVPAKTSPSSETSTMSLDAPEQG
jgi:hypothetical protein